MINKDGVNSSHSHLVQVPRPTKMSSKGLRLSTSSTGDAASHDGSDSHSLPIYHMENVTRPPSYSSRRHSQQTSPAGPRQRMNAHRPTSSISPISSVSQHTSLGTPRPSMSDSETYASEDISQPPPETIGVFPLPYAGAPFGSNVGVGQWDSRSMFDGELRRPPSDDGGPFPQDRTSASGSPIASTSRMPPRYIYYQVYSEGEAIHAKTAFTEDPFMGRIIAKKIAPPHTAASIKRYLSKQEDVHDYSRTTLFASLSSPSALEDQNHVSILTANGPGSSPMEPMALVILDPPTQATAGPSASAPSFWSSTGTSSIITVDREPIAPNIVGYGQPVAVQHHNPSKEEIKRSKAEEKKRKKEEKKARIERLAEQLKASARERDKAPPVRPPRAPTEATIFGGLARLSM